MCDIGVCLHIKLRVIKFIWTLKYNGSSLIQFAKTILMNYQFEEIQKLKFVVYDIDDKKHLEDTSKHDLIGLVECTLADIVTAGQEYKRTLREKGMLLRL